LFYEKYTTFVIPTVVKRLHKEVRDFNYTHTNVHFFNYSIKKFYIKTNFDFKIPISFNFICTDKKQMLI